MYVVNVSCVFLRVLCDWRPPSWTRRPLHISVFSVNELNSQFVSSPPDHVSETSASLRDKPTSLQPPPASTCRLPGPHIG